MSANRLLNYALETRDRGVHFPADAFEFEAAVILSINDASHAASFDSTNEGHIVGHRSQSGRILALSSKEFLETGKGKVHLLQWTSNVIKRVCRSTLQAETLSLQLGSEDAEHMRQLLYVIKNKATALNRTENFINAMDDTVVSWYTDCRSLSDHLMNVNAAAVSDKRLAIDLTSLRQELWRERGNLVGNPTYSDELPPDRTTLCSWVLFRHGSAARELIVILDGAVDVTHPTGPGANSPRHRATVKDSDITEVAETRARRARVGAVFGAVEYASGSFDRDQNVYVGANLSCTGKAVGTLEVLIIDFNDLWQAEVKEPRLAIVLRTWLSRLASVALMASLQQDPLSHLHCREMRQQATHFAVV
eukprot:s4110_g2.t1